MSIVLLEGETVIKPPKMLIVVFSYPFNTCKVNLKQYTVN